jgi:hypothetical protein
VKHSVYGEAGIRAIEFPKSATGELDAVPIHGPYKKFCLFRKKYVKLFHGRQEGVP